MLRGHTIAKVNHLSYKQNRLPHYNTEDQAPMRGLADENIPSLDIWTVTS